tara:strand:+ start:5755 stop:6051 length:297 start_codon:yes stop_codon:yes gene_type:complete
MKITEKRQLLAEAKRFNPYSHPAEDIKMFKRNGVYYGVSFGGSAYYQWTPLRFSLKRWKRDHHDKATQLLAELKRNPFMQQHREMLERLEINLEINND